MKELTGKKFWIILLLGFISFTFVSGSYNVDIMALLAPIFFLLITRNTTKLRDFLLIGLCMGIAGIIKFPGFLQLGFPLDQVAAFSCSLICLLPYIADRFIYRNFIKEGNLTRKFVGTFILPFVFTVMEVIYGYIPLGMFLSIVTTQNDILPLTQFASLLGQFGLAFIIMWVPSFIYFLIDVIANTRKKSILDFFHIVKVPLCIFLAVYVAIFTFGELRLTFDIKSDNYVKVAYAHGVKQYQDKNGKWVIEDLDTLKKAFSTQTKIAAQNGAKLLCFNEEAFYLADNDLDNFLDFISKETKANKIYTLTGIEAQSLSHDELDRNMAVLTDPDGKIISQYNKSKSIPILETRKYQKGDASIPIMTLTLQPNVPSIVSTAICFEGEFNSYINQVGPETDIHLNPSKEWLENCEFHNQALQLRAIEHGMSVIEPTTDNTSSIFDYLGNIVASSSTSGTGYDEVTFGSIPAQGVYTIYVLGGYIADYFYTPGLIIFIILAIARYKKCKYKQNDTQLELNDK